MPTLHSTPDQLGEQCSKFQLRFNAPAPVASCTALLQAVNNDVKQSFTFSSSRRITNVLAYATYFYHRNTNCFVAKMMGILN